MAITRKPGVVSGKDWYSSRTGYYYDSKEAADHYDRLEQMKSAIPADSGLNGLSTEELKTHIEGRMAAQAVQQALEESKPPIPSLVKFNPWYVDCDENSAVMVEEVRAQMHARRLMPPLRYEDWLRIATELRDKGLLPRVNREALIDQEVARVQQEIASQHVYTEDELYDMPLDKLECLYRGLPVKG